MSDIVAKLRWLSIRKKDLDEQFEEANKNGSSEFAQFIQEDLEKIAAEIELLKSQSKSSRPKRQHDDSDEGRWRLVGKTMTEVCVESKLQDYISQAFRCLHAYILKTLNESHFFLKTVHFRFTSGHLKDQTLSTIFRFDTSFLFEDICLTLFCLFLQKTHSCFIYENLACASAAKHSSRSIMF
jgi:hypothetical protein